jgi:O-antigen/teichoic acid export membrane protein
MLLRNSLIYLVGRLGQAIIMFGAISLYSRLLHPHEYGEYSLVMASVLLTHFLVLGWLCESILRLYPSAKNPRSFLCSLFVGYVGVIGLAAVVCAIYTFILSDHRMRMLVLLGFWLFAASGWLEINLHLLISGLQATAHTWANLIRTALGAGVGATLAYFGWGSDGIIFGMTVGVLGPSLWLTSRMLRNMLPLEFHVRALFHLFRYGLPLGASFGLYALATTTDRFVLSWIEGISVVGLYAIGFELADRVVSAVMVPIGNASFPLAVRAMGFGTHELEEQLKRNIILLAAIGMPTAAGLAVVAGDLVTIAVGEAYRDLAMNVLPIIALASFAANLRARYFDHAYLLANRTRRTVLLMGLIVGASLVLNPALTSAWGASGTAAAVLLVHCIGLVLSAALAPASCRMPIPARELVKVVAATGLMVMAVKLAPDDPGFLSLLRRVAIGLSSYLVGTYVLNVGNIRAGILAWIKRPR